jgi:ABC-type lipoprotein export system ATPase subunit
MVPEWGPPLRKRKRMKLKNLKITNFRAIESLEISDLSGFVVIAGANGCGKTTIFDALRLLKSVYVQDEWHRWYGEFGINIQQPTNFAGIFRDPLKPAVISTSIELAEEERQFLLGHASNIAAGLIANYNKRHVTITGDPIVTLATVHGVSAEEQLQIANLTTGLITQLNSACEFTASVTIQNTPSMEFAESLALQAAFSCFRPDVLGELEFHTSRRTYARETINSVNLNVGDRVEERRNRFLYDLDNKYRNVKSQLVEEYVASILRREDPLSGPLHTSMMELFRTFFPGKEFLGVTLGKNNSLTFPVRLSTGEIHDIDELSSGEKEIVYGYLRLRTGTPRRSIVLIDEPELHLNPALVQGLVPFYRKNLADALDTQVWIVTHSDAILRQAVRSSDTTVYHMARPKGDGSQQAIRLGSQDEVEAAILDLIGDLAAYRPYARIVLVEGRKETRFDVDMIRRLFPDLAERGNFMPAGNRRMTNGIRSGLLDILKEAGLTGRAVSICDGDLGLDNSPLMTGEFRWPVYEIENFLLIPSVLRGALVMMLRTDPYSSDQEVIGDLRQIATQLTPKLAIDEVQYAINGEIFDSINIYGDPRRPLQSIVEASHASIKRVANLDMSERKLKDSLDSASAKLTALLQTDDFLQRFPGDRLIRAFAGKHGVSGEHFRNAALDVAQRNGVRPSAMELVIREALA